MSLVCDRACRAQLLNFWSKVLLYVHVRTRVVSPQRMENALGRWVWILFGVLACFCDAFRKRRKTIFIIRVYIVIIIFMAQKKRCSVPIRLCDDAMDASSTNHQTPKIAIIKIRQAYSASDGWPVARPCTRWKRARVVVRLARLRRNAVASEAVNRVVVTVLRKFFQTNSSRLSTQKFFTFIDARTSRQQCAN